MPANRDFLGVGFKFPLEFARSGGLKRTVGTSISSDINRVQESLKHIFAVSIGERPWRRGFGTRLRELVFMPLEDYRLESFVDLYIRQAIERWEPRVDVLDITVSDLRRDEGVLDIDVEFRIIQTNVTGNFVYPFYLNNTDAPNDNGG